MSKSTKSTESNRDVLEKIDQVTRIKFRKTALHSMGGIPEHNRPTHDELNRMLVIERERFLSMLSRDTVTVWLYNKPVLRGLVYALLMMYTDNDGDCFPPAMDGFSYVDDAQILDHSFSSGDFWFPSECMCVVMLGVAKRNSYLTEIINSFVRRRMVVKKQRTIFLFEGTRNDFARLYGEVSSFELNRDSYIIDWNERASENRNSARHIEEGQRSFTEKSVSVASKEPNGDSEIHLRSDTSTKKSALKSGNIKSKGRTKKDTSSRIELDDYKPQESDISERKSKTSTIF